MGQTRRLPSHKVEPSECRKVMVIDDSILTGTQMNHVRQLICEANIEQDIIYSAVYAAPGVEDKVDLFFEICPSPRIFGWNFMHSDVLRSACVDIDGVICRDPIEEENDDGVRYSRFIEICEPLFLPTLPIANLVTCRLEKYRKPTERWLKSHNVKYERLIMMDFPNKEERVKSGSHGAFKARIYRDTRTKLFIESSLKQAIEIADRAGKPVLCIEVDQIIYPSATSLCKAAYSLVPKYLESRKSIALSKIGAFLLKHQ